MRILAVAQVEDRTNLDRQILKQTIQPFRTVFLIDKNPGKTIDERRVRIVQNHKKLRDIVKAYDCDYVWQIEQDGEYPSDTLERLINDLNKVDVNKLAYVSGIQVGRHGLYCLGAWTDITKTGFKSLDYKKTGLQPVDATGFYCLLAPKDRWLSGIASWQGEPYGPDVVWAMSIHGNKYCDMDVQIGHIIKNGTIWPAHLSTCNVVFQKHHDGRWGYKQID